MHGVYMESVWVEAEDSFNGIYGVYELLMEGASGLKREVTSREAAYISTRPALSEERTWSWTRQGVDTTSRLQLSRS